VHCSYLIIILIPQYQLYVNQIVLVGLRKVFCPVPADKRNEISGHPVHARD
jgi:hypothetical protein